MNEVKWIKIVTNIFNDEKILIIEDMPEGDGIIVIWFKLLCLAGICNRNGQLILSNRIAYTENMLSSIFRRPLNIIRLALTTFEQLGMIEIIDNIITIPNWCKHQNIKGLEEIREKTRLRVQKFREQQCSVTSNVTVTLPSNSISNISNSNSSNRDIISNKALEKEFETLWKLYPNKKGKSNALKYYIRERKNNTTYEEVLKGIENYNQEIKVQNTPLQYIKHGSSWFNQKSWLDIPNLTPNYNGKKEKAKPDWLNTYIEEEKIKRQNKPKEKISLEEIEKLYGKDNIERN